MPTKICFLPLLVGLALLLPWVVAVPEVHARVAYPTQPQRWLMVASPDRSGVAVHTRRWGDAFAAWPDGSVLGLLGELVVEHGTTWVTVQDPEMNQGWVMLDQWADLPTPVEPTPRREEEGEVGGVQPLDGTGRSATCPFGFPIKGTTDRQGRLLRRAIPPESSGYGDVSTVTCFRSPIEALAWRFDYRPPVQQSVPPEADAAEARLQELHP